MYAPKTMISAAATIFLALGVVHASPTPPITSNDCTQLSFVTAYNCDRIDPALNNNTLTAAGWQCCWHEGPFAPPPDGIISAWLKVNDQGVVIDRCLTNGTCTDVN